MNEKISVQFCALSNLKFGLEIIILNLKFKIIDLETAVNIAVVVKLLNQQN